MKTFLLVFLFMLSFVAYAQPRPPPEQQMPRYGDRPEPQWHVDRVPDWCRNYDRHMYYRELRRCDDDKYCRRQVRRKGEKCGLS